MIIIIYMVCENMASLQFFEWLSTQMWTPFVSGSGLKSWLRSQNQSYWALGSMISPQRGHPFPQCARPTHALHGGWSTFDVSQGENTSWHVFYFTGDITYFLGILQSSFVNQIMCFSTLSGAVLSHVPEGTRNAQPFEDGICIHSCPGKNATCGQALGWTWWYPASWIQPYALECINVLLFQNVVL